MIRGNSYLLWFCSAENLHQINQLAGHFQRQPMLSYLLKNIVFKSSSYLCIEVRVFVLPAKWNYRIYGIVEQTIANLQTIKDHL